MGLDFLLWLAFSDDGIGFSAPARLLTMGLDSLLRLAFSDDGIGFSAPAHLLWRWDWILCSGLPSLMMGLDSLLWLAFSADGILDSLLRLAFSDDGIGFCTPARLLWQWDWILYSGSPSQNNANQVRSVCNASRLICQGTFRKLTWIPMSLKPKQAKKAKIVAVSKDKLNVFMF